MSYIPGYSPARSWKKLTLFDLLLILAVLIAGILFARRAAGLTGHAWDWAALGRYLLYEDAEGAWQSGLLIKGLFSTIRLGLWSMLLALISGGLVGALTANQRGLAALPANLYINLMRNTPPLVLLFLVFFFAGSFFTEPLLQVEAWLAQTAPGLRNAFHLLVAPPGQLDRMLAAVLTLGLYTGAYVAEIVRSGLESVPKGQWEASAAQGFGKWQQYRHIIAPQALRLLLPPLIGQTISAFKETTLASIISLPELTFQSLEIMAVSRLTFELWLSVAVIYLFLSLFWSGLGGWLERRRRWRPI